MKQVVLCTSVFCLLGLGGALQATPILAPPVGQCTAAAGAFGSPTDLILPFATWSSSGFACEQQDKIYSNFSPGAILNSATLRLQVQPVGAADFHTVTFNGNFLTDFVVSYDIAIDLTINPTELITRVSGDISNPINIGVPSNLTTVAPSLSPGSPIGSFTSVPNSPGAILVTANTALHVVDGFSHDGGAAVSVSDTFEEEIRGGGGGVPEPLTYCLVGGGFVLLASLQRIRRRN